MFKLTTAQETMLRAYAAGSKYVAGRDATLHKLRTLGMIKLNREHGTHYVATDAGRAWIADRDATPAKKCGTVTSTGIHRNICQKPATGADGMCTRCRNFLAPRPHRCQMCGTDPAQCVNNTTPAPAPVDTFGRPAPVVTVDGKTYAIVSVDEFGAIHTRQVLADGTVTAHTDTINPGAVPALDAAAHASGNFAFARAPQYVPAADGADVHVHDYSCAIPCEVPNRRPAALPVPLNDMDAIRVEELARAHAEALAANDGYPLNVIKPADALAALQAVTAEPVAKTAAEGRCDGGKWCRCRNADGDLITYADALKPHNRTDARREVKPPTHTDAYMVTWDTNTKHRGDGTRTACGKVGRLAQFGDGYKATCTADGCLEAWAR